MPDQDKISGIERALDLQSTLLEEMLRTNRAMVAELRLLRNMAKLPEPEPVKLDHAFLHV